MLLFYVSHFPAQFLKPSVFERAKDERTGDAAKAESKERFVSLLLLLCVLAAGIYDEILRYAL